jgi:cytochrome c553
MNKVAQWVIGGIVALMVLPLMVQLVYVAIGETVFTNHKQEKMTYTDPARVYAQKCAACHGEQGDGSEGYPRLNSQNAGTLAFKLKGYKNGSYGTGSGAEVMKLQVAEFEDKFIDSLAQTISSLKPNETIHQKIKDEDKKRDDNRFDPGMNS